MPSPFCLEAAEKWALDRAALLPASPFRLMALWTVSFLVQPVPGERRTAYPMRIAQTEHYGTAVGLSGLPDPDPELIGQDARHVLAHGSCQDPVDRAAVVDSVMSHVSRPADRELIVDGAPPAKYVARAELFADEASTLLRRAISKQSRPHALVVGATAGIIGALVGRGFAVSATDLWPEAVGHELGGVRVENGATANARLMKDADLAVITGMTLSNRTLADLMALAHTHSTATMIWAVTGRSFGDYYTEHGVDCVISDPSPFLLLPGPAAMAVWRRKPRESVFGAASAGAGLG
jgi:hypothetical protein